MSLEVTVTRLRPEEDDYRDNSAEPHFKRTRAWGQAKRGKEEIEFVIILDIRARLLSVRGEKDKELAHADALAIGQAILNEMALFVARPIGHLLVRAEETERAEWIVLDADHVNGLLHRLRERKTFNERTTPPMPRRWREITEDLLSAAIENLRQVNLTWNPSSDLSAEHVPALDLSTWEVNRERFIDWTDDRETRERFARLFEYYRSYAQMWGYAIQGIRSRGVHPDNSVVTIDRAAVLVGPAAVWHLRRTRDDAIRMLPELVDELGTPLHKEHLDKAMHAQAQR